jgi:FkbH-like protein
MLKLVLWDLDQTILTGVLEEGDEEISPDAAQALQVLHERGVLQALCTQNTPALVTEAVANYRWTQLFFQIEADLGPKVEKVQRVLEAADIHPSDSWFVDDDAFERDAIRVQIPQINTCSVAELREQLQGDPVVVTDESKRRTQLYKEDRQRQAEAQVAESYDDFLRSCNVRIAIRPYHRNDIARVKELITRTHRMNLGILPIDEAVRRLGDDSYRVIIATMKDRYSDMGRCGVAHVTPLGSGQGIIESLAISCRTRSRGLALAMLTGLLRHPQIAYPSYTCRYRSNGRNRPLRMLLMAAGFNPVPESDQLRLETGQLWDLALPDWVELNYEKEHAATT